MTRFFNALWYAAASVIAVVGVASAARAEMVAEWTFASAATFLDDSSGNGHTLTNGGASQTPGFGAVGDSSAFFSGTAIMNSNAINLSSYRQVVVSWYSLDWGQNTEMIWEQSVDLNANVGAIDVASNSAGVGIGGVGARTAGSHLYDTESVVLHATGNSNRTWDQVTVVFNRDAALVGGVYPDAIKVYVNGILTGVDGMASDPIAPFLNDAFYLGARRNTNGVLSAGFEGLIDEVKIEGFVPEPASLALLGLGALALLRRRRA